MFLSAAGHKRLRKSAAGFVSYKYRSIFIIKSIGGKFLQSSFGLFSLWISRPNLHSIFLRVNAINNQLIQPLCRLILV